MRLVDNWKNFWKWYSTHVFAVLAVMPQVWANLDPQLKDTIPEAWMPNIATLIAVAGIVSRIKAQGRAG